MDAFLGTQGLRRGPGRAWGAFAPDPIAILVAEDPSPGDGYHREHVRILRGHGDAGALEELAALAARDVGPSVRLEGESEEGSTHEAAFEAAGLAREASLPGGHADGRAVVAWGRPAEGRRAAPGPWQPDVPTRPRLDVSIVVVDDALRPVLETFLADLVPGRAYPPGTLLSEAERHETRRAGQLALPWMLALRDGVALGGVVMERLRPPHRAHVARVHVDVRPAARGCGIAARLLAKVRDEAPRWGVTRLEADPAACNVGAWRALEAAGFGLAGIQRGAWRMRGPSGLRDEDVRLYSAGVSPPAA